jgi:type 2 lantibiotic biosynthesis protein LanM
MSEGLPADATGGWLPADSRKRAWQAATLAERLTLARTTTAAGGAPPAAERAAWARAIAPGNPAAFDRRLAWDGIDDRMMALALSPDPPGPVSAEWPAAAWVAWLPEFLACARACAADVGTSVWREEVESLNSAPEPPFLEAWVPVVRTATAAWLRRQPPSTLRLLPEARLGFQRHLVRQAAAVGAAALYDVFEANGDPNNGRYRRFIGSLLEGGWGEVLDVHPVLARHLARLSADWIDGIVEMVSRLAADAEAITCTFGIQPGPIAAAQPGLSDRHAGGRTVTRLDLGSGLRLAYKPRNVGLEASFNHLLAWLSAAGLDCVPRPLRIVDRGTHGWVEWVAPTAFESRDEVSRYFRRAGGLACLVHVLGGADLHGENVVASAGGPSLIDAEMLLQPSAGARTFEAPEGDDAGTAASAQSCLGPGFLSLVQVETDGRAYDIGGLQPAPPRAAAVARREWRDVGSDTLHQVADRTVHPVLTNDVRLEGTVQPPSAWADAICAGFEATSDFLAARRDMLTAPGGPIDALGRSEVRVLFRPSDQYGVLLYLLATPRYQRRGLDRSIALETLLRVFVAEDTKPLLWPLVAEEREALERLDIPRFTLPASSATLVSASGEVVPGHFSGTGADGVRARLGALGREELRFQIDEVRAALQPPFVTVLRGAAERPAGLDSKPGLEYDRLLRAAEATGEVILTRADPALTSPSWPSCRASADLYGGTAGVCLFLAALSAVTGAERWRARASAAVAALLQSDALSRALAASRLGACGGVPSIAYALLLAGRWLGESDAVAASRDLLARLPAAGIDTDAVLDVEGGAAGALLVLLAAEVDDHEPRFLELAGRCVSRLLAAQVRNGPDQGAWRAGADARPRPGFAHGAAGIACALERWLEFDSSTTVVSAIRAAWAFERRVFQASGGTWPTVRLDGSRVLMAAWCHGAPGIALARATGGGRASDEQTEFEIEAALKHTASAPRGRFDHLCCGSLGRADVLLTAGRCTGRQAEAGLGAEMADSVATQILQAGRLGLRGQGYQRGAPAVGLFQGLAGIGYQLLRTAAPGALPSVLAFEPQPWRRT